MMCFFVVVVLLFPFVFVATIVLTQWHPSAHLPRKVFVCVCVVFLWKS